MKTRIITISLLAATLFAWTVVPVLAQEGGEMDPAMAEMMAKWEVIKTPGAQHQMLAELVGTWDAVAKFWMDPSQPPSEATGTAEFKMILGGRYLQQNLTSVWMGQEMHGMGLTAYDNFRQEFIDLWVDDMGTGIYVSRGTTNEKGDVLTLRGTMDDPMTGQKDIPSRSVSMTVDENTHKVEMYMTGSDGTEFKSMEVVYTRKK